MVEETFMTGGMIGIQITEAILSAHHTEDTEAPQEAGALQDTNEEEVEAGVCLAARVVIKADTGVGTRAGAGAGVGAQDVVLVQRISNCH